MKNLNVSSGGILNYLFQNLLVLYLFLTVIDTIRAGTVVKFINTDYLLVTIIVSGILLMVDHINNKQTFSKITVKEETGYYAGFAAIIILLSILMFNKTGNRILLSCVLAIIMAVIIIGTCFLKFDYGTKKRIKFRIKPILKKIILISAFLITFFSGGYVIYNYPSGTISFFKNILYFMICFVIPGFFLYDLIKKKEDIRNKKMDLMSIFIDCSISLIIGLSVIPLAVFALEIFNIRIGLFNTLIISFVFIVPLILLKILKWHPCHKSGVRDIKK